MFKTIFAIVAIVAILLSTNLALAQESVQGSAQNPTSTPIQVAPLTIAVDRSILGTHTGGYQGRTGFASVRLIINSIDQEGNLGATSIFYQNYCGGNSAAKGKMTGNSVTLDTEANRDCVSRRFELKWSEGRLAACRTFQS